MYELKRIWLEKDAAGKRAWQQLLLSNDLVPDDQADFTLGLFDQGKLIGTGSLYRNIIKLVTVAPEYQHENLLTRMITALTTKLREEGMIHFFLYTKPCTAISFQSLGFKEIIRTNALAFMEQGTPDFSDYLKFLESHKETTSSASAIVMNANPFTKGHLHLVETAAKESEVVYIFVLSEERSEFSAQERMQLVEKGTRHLNNVITLPTRDYQVSSATFPSYFLKNQAKENVARVQAHLDAALFKEKIAPLLNIQTRYVGEEPFSPVTNVYNESMHEVFSSQLKLTIVPRLKMDGQVVSATRVREALKENDFEMIRKLVPPTTLTYLQEIHQKEENRGEESGN